MKIIYLISFIFLTISCGQNKLDDRSLVRKNISKDSLIVILNTQYDNDVVLGFNDLFGNRYDINRGITKVPRGVFITDIHWKHQLSFFVPDSIKRIEFKKDSEGYFFIETQNPNLDYLLNVDLVIRKAIDPIKSEQDSFDRIFKFSNIKNDDEFKKRNLYHDNLYNKKVAFLNEYTQLHKLDSMVINVWKRALIYEKLSSKLNFSQYNKLSPDVIKAFAAEVNNEDIKDADLLIPHFQSYLSFNRLLISYLKYKSDFNTIPNLMSISVKHFEGKIRDWLMFDLLQKTDDRNYGFKVSQQEKTQMTNTFLSICKTDEFKDYIKERIILNNTNLKIDELVNINNEVIPLNKVIKGKISFVDFWASWCAPCRAEMPASKKMRLAFSKKGINFIYISIDENPSAWKKAIRQIGLGEDENYLLPKGNESELAKKFKIESIPRYMIIGKDGKVINADALRPSDPKLKEIFDELLKEK